MTIVSPASRTGPDSSNNNNKGEKKEGRKEERKEVGLDGERERKRQGRKRGGGSRGHIKTSTVKML